MNNIGSENVQGINKKMIAFCGTYCGVCEWKDKIGCKGCKANGDWAVWL